MSKRWRSSRAPALAAGLLLALGGCGHASSAGAGAASTPSTDAASVPPATGTAATTPSTDTASTPAATATTITVTPPPPPNATTAASATPYRCAPGARTLCVMANDNGRTFTVPVGSFFTVELRAAHRSFSAPTESGAKVLALIAASHSGGAAEGYYRALAPGHAVIHAVERPVCARGRVCPDFLLLWQVQVHVVR